MNDIAHRLSQMIEKRDTSYGALSEKTGIPKSAIHRYATGETTNIPIDRISLLAEALNVDAEYLLGWDEVEEKDKDKIGVHKDNLSHFSDKPELLSLYNKIYENERLQLLFDTAKDLTPEDLETILIHIQGIRKARGLD